MKTCVGYLPHWVLVQALQQDGQCEQHVLPQQSAGQHLAVAQQVAQLLAGTSWAIEMAPGMASKAPRTINFNMMTPEKKKR